MGMGSLTLACVMLLANAGAEPETFHLKSPRMKIPITIDPSQRTDLREIILWYSSDEGKNWKQGPVAQPEQTEFPFNAPGDGKYWFTIQTVSKRGDKIPLDPATGAVGQKIVVDSVKPLVKLRAERKADEIVASWEVTEDYPNPSTFVVEYHLADQPAPVWTPLPALPGATGTATIKPAPLSALTIQLRVKDLAENEGKETVEVAAATPHDAPLPTPPSPPTPAGPQGSSWSGQPLAGPNTGPGALALPPVGPAAVSPSPIQPALRGALPPKQLINKPEVRLDFDVNNLGPSGFGTVDAYVSTDEGAHWSQVALDPGAIQPPESRGPGQARGSVQVKLLEDGKIYGFYLVVKSRAMLGKEPPRNGDLPHIRIERDMLCPSASLVSALPDPTRRDTIILRWKAEDKNLTDKPITLEWSARPDQGWEFIGGPELPNTGNFAWQVPPAAAMATKVYFKLTVRDGAGNTAVAQTENAVTVDLNIPEVAGVSISPAR